MTRDKIKEGDICTLDESVAYSYYPHKPYEVVVLWHGVNSQPLVTKLDAYKPFWTTYSQLIEVNRHIDLSIKALEQQTCEDAVSRQAVLDAMYALCDTGETLKENPWRDNPHIDAVAESIERIPSVNPQPKVGYWEWVRYDSNPNIGNWHCSKCRTIIPYMPEETDNAQIYEQCRQYRFCPNCGAKMIEPQESEVEE